MTFSHHSHSGQFCAHAKGSLEDMVLTAIAKGMTLYCLTEHMPRDMVDLYPEEGDLIKQASDFDDISRRFYAEACRLRDKYQSQISILIGFESEWIRESSLSLIRSLQDKYDWDFFVGSLHHVHTIPIDFDRPYYEKARAEAGGLDERLFEDYFDAQLQMLQALKPVVVGHFDLIRLLSDEPNEPLTRYAGVWTRVLRNLHFVASYGGVLELNTSALRKGLHEPYPSVDICKAFLQLGGKFTLSDDAHAIEQVGTNYGQVVQAIQAAGISELAYLRKSDGGGISISSVRFVEMADHQLFAA